MAISYQEARAKVLAYARPHGTERVALAQMIGRVLAAPITAQFDLPRFDNSAMDGFGVHLADVAEASPERPVPLALSATIRAGDAAGDAVPSGATVKILTGAPIPDGVEAVVMAEDAEESNGVVSVRRAVKSGENIRWKGEEYRTGDTVVEADTIVTPPVVGLLATFGYTYAEAYQRPKLAVIVTGSELAQPGESLQSPQIYDANSYTLTSALAAIGFMDITLARVSDDVEATKKALSQAFSQADIVLAVGGVSVGEFDWVKKACAELGVQTEFWGVAIKPAKPTFFGTYTKNGRTQLVFGLPGNPVAVLVAYHQFVKPALFACMGATPPTARWRAILTTAMKKKRGRLEFARGTARIEEGNWVVTPTSGQGSHMLGGLAAANCLIHVPEETKSLLPDDVVEIEFIAWT